MAADVRSTRQTVTMAARSFNKIQEGTIGVWGSTWNRFRIAVNADVLGAFEVVVVSHELTLVFQGPVGRWTDVPGRDHEDGGPLQRETNGTRWALVVYVIPCTFRHVADLHLGSIEVCPPIVHSRLDEIVDGVVG